MTYEEEPNDSLHDSRIKGFGERLTHAIGQQSWREFSRKCGLSEAVLRSYRDGNTFPTLDRLDAIAYAANADPAWLLVGQDQVHEPPGKYAVLPTDLDRLERIITLVEQGVEKMQVRLPAGKKANIITLAWRDEKNTNAPVELETILQFIDLAK